ncbi:class I SAM-dependent methyltransferase [Polynucleobacter paneuropaeus]|uniref:class I SAM-dependent methyltransferase n=1 Tax=Polynucleobacter paneuropaeus TaxID=2527775 RepID=UPI001BFDD043|nr:class I SAM-dependent methyltransferase [Polynucleobacter paneuropaeus]QWD49712.1 class I SAM-dependent methyltransferase [Polynucleobacter paneuropaeus]
MKNLPINSLPLEVNCKICGEISPTLGSIDFNRSRKEWLNYAPSPSKKMVFYNQCPSCGFVFTIAFDNWQHHDFTKYIYNEFYNCIDAGASEREVNNTVVIADFFQKSKNLLKVLDYGGGNGGFSRALTQKGFHVESFDPFVGTNKSINGHHYDLITSYEVLEHTTNPQSTINEMISLLKESGVVIFSTLVQPNDFEERGLFWWYVSPRSGHVSIYSKKSLIALWRSAGFNVSSFNDNLHIAYKEIPKFSSHLFTMDEKKNSQILITKRSLPNRIIRKIKRIFKAN